MSGFLQFKILKMNFNKSKVQQILESQKKSQYFQPLFKNKTWVRPGYLPSTPKNVPIKPTLMPSPKYLQMQQEIEEFVLEEQEFEQLMDECFEQQNATLLEDEYDFIRETCAYLSVAN